jgi:hypothetical protein
VKGIGFKWLPLFSLHYDTISRPDSCHLSFLDK